MKHSRKSVLIPVVITGLLLICGCLNDPQEWEDERPEILIEPQSQAAMYDDTVELKVSVEYEPTITFQWFKSDTMITNEKDSILTIANVTFADTGEYFVFVSNRTGYVISCKVRLFVSGGEPVVATLPVSNGLDVKDSIKLTAQVAGYPPFSYQWFKNKFPIVGAVENTYTIRSFSYADSGSYSVVVKNSIGTDTSNVSKLYVAGKLFITEADFISGSGYMEWMSIKTSKITEGGFALFQDVGIKTFGNYIYLIERYGADNISKYDPSKKGESAFLYQKKLGDNWNPQDIEFVSETKAYIANMNEPKITMFDPSTGTFLGNIDISSYTYMPDTINTSPHANDLQLVGSDLYVMLQRRIGNDPGAKTMILKINTITDKITDSITLNYKNGHSMTYANGALYISNPGSANVIGDGAIEKVDLLTKKVSIIIDESVLRGSPNNIVHKEGEHFYITNYVGWQQVPVLEIDAATKTIQDTLDGIKDAFGGIYFDAISNKLFVGERDDIETGVKIFIDNKQIGSTIRTANTLPPSGFVIIR